MTTAQWVIMTTCTYNDSSSKFTSISKGNSLTINRFNSGVGEIIRTLRFSQINKPLVVGNSV